MLCVSGRRGGLLGWLANVEEGVCCASGGIGTGCWVELLVVV